MTKIRIVAGLLLALMAFTACQTTEPGEAGPVTDQLPGQRPSLNSDEAGLWMMMDRAEQGLKTSGNLVRDKALNVYVQGIVCRLAGEYCPDIRVYVVRMPYFNASMAPNGVMQVWTGLILRAKSEAQLSAVIGHEIGHYLRRHSLQMLRDVRNTTGFLVFFQLASAAAGVPEAGNIAQLISVGSITGFSRDNEREADRVGLRLMVKAGYDPSQAAKVWGQLIREDEADEDKKFRSIFFATHPPPAERQETLAALAENAAKNAKLGEIGAKRFHRITGPHRTGFLRDEMHLRRFSRAGELLNILLEDGTKTGELKYFQGEIYRLRGEEGDVEKALKSYRAALDDDGTPPEIHRSMALIYARTGKTEKARAAYAKYLELRPDAEDRKMIEVLMKQLG